MASALLENVLLDGVLHVLQDVEACWKFTSGLQNLGRFCSSGAQLLGWIESISLYIGEDVASTNSSLWRERAFQVLVCLEKAHHKGVTILPDSRPTILGQHLPKFMTNQSKFFGARSSERISQVFRKNKPLCGYVVHVWGLFILTSR